MRRLLSLLIAAAMVLPMTVSFASADSALPAESDAQISAALVSQENRDSGLVGFEGAYALEETRTPVSIIVELAHQPAGLVEAVAEAGGERLTESTEVLEARAAADREAFFEALEGVDYTVEYVYDQAINGFAVTVPEDQVDEIAGLDCVFAVYPNEVYENAAAGSTAGSGASQGLADSRAYFDMDALYARGLTGRGVTVGVIDTGVDYEHPDLADAFADTLPDGRTPSADELLNGKFYGRNYINNGNGANDPMDDHGHGTHVCGTIAARGVSDTGISAKGIACEATLAVYKALNSSNGCQLSDVVMAMEDAVEDGCTIISMSLGWSSANGARHGTSLALNSLALQNEDVLFVVCAGNNGSNNFTVWSPGTSPLALTVANAMIPSENRMLTLTRAGADADSQLRLIRSDWSNAVVEDDGGDWRINALRADPNGDYRMVLLPTVDGSALGTGTQAEFNAFFAEMTEEEKAEYAGALFVVNRGEAFDSSVPRIRGSVGTGAIVVLNTEARKNDFENISWWQGYYKNYLPVFTMQYEEGQALIDGLEPGESYSFRFTDAEDLVTVAAEAGDYPAADTSRGPVTETYDLKPDLAAPGTAVISTVYKDYNGQSDDHTYAYDAMSGTSMATPHVSAFAALLRQQAPDLTALEIKALLVNTADTTAFGDSISRFAVGAGMVDPAAALEALDDMVLMTVENPNGYNNADLNAAVQTPVISLGGTAEGTAMEKTVTVTVDNRGAQSHTYSIELVNTTHAGQNGSANAQPADDGIFSLSTDTVTMPAGQTVTFELSIALDETAVRGSYETTVLLTDENGGQLHSPTGAYVYRVEPISSNPINSSYTFIHNAVLSSGEDMQLKNYGWHGSDRTFYQFRFRDASVETWQPLLYTREGELVGMLDSWYTDSWGRWDWYYYDTIGTWVCPCTFDDNGGLVPTGSWGPMEEGAYEIRLLLGKTGAESRIVTIADLYVDNTLPEITTGSGTTWYGQPRGKTVTYKGSIYDAGTEEMMSLGIDSTVDLRVFGNHISQKDNVVVVEAGGSYYRAEISEDGSFTVRLPLEAASGTATVYYGDHFLPIGSDARYGYFYDGFNPYELSYTVETSVRNVPYMTCFGYRAANMASYEVKLGKYSTGGDTGTKPQEPQKPQEPAGPEMPFTDLQGHWCADDAAFVYERGLMQGTAKDIFSPDETLTRGMVVTMLYRLSGAPAVDAKAGFIDVPADAYYADAVNWAFANGVTNGTSEMTFAPNDAVTRQELAALLFRYAGLQQKALTPGVSLEGFSDAADIAGWAQEAMRWAAAEGIVTGSSGRLLPQDSASRGEAAAMFHRLIEQVLED